MCRTDTLDNQTEKSTLALINQVGIQDLARTLLVPPTASKIRNVNHRFYRLGATCTCFCFGRQCT